MDIRENLGQEYLVCTQQLYDKFNTGVNELYYIIEKYGNYERYPRKLKKFLNKKQWWEIIKRGNKLNPGLVTVTNRLYPKNNW